MNEDRVRRFLEKGGAEEGSHGLGKLTHGLHSLFFETFIMQGLRVCLIEPGLLICSLSVLPRLLNADGGSLHGGAMATLVDVLGSAAIATVSDIHPIGVSVEINISYFDAPSLSEEIEIEAEVLHVGKNTGAVSVEFRKKNGKIIAHGRHTKYLAVPMRSKM